MQALHPLARHACAPRRVAAATAALIAAVLVWLVAAPPAAARPRPLPWQEAGLSERQAAVHLLNRFTWGPRPADVDRVLALGLGNWLDQQLQGDAPGPVLAAALARFSTTSLAPREMFERYPHHAQVVAQAVADGVVDEADVTGERGEARQRRAVAALERYADDQGFRPRSEVLGELRAQKLYRALYSESQVVEVLTDFWFNHFNVSAESADCRQYVLSFERDAIRPHVTGTFRELLGATARHPAMLLYLSNSVSTAEPAATTTFDLVMARRTGFSPTGDASFRQRLARELKWRPPARRDLGAGPVRGLNENYARELLELHTLGVDGGYDQGDVVEVARAFTGWTTLTRRKTPERLERMLAQAAEQGDLGFVAAGGFLFRADHHDSDAKVVLGVPLPAGRGLDDGEQVLDLLARHPATARHLARKLAVRFVADHPDAALVDRLARRYEISGGDLREVVWAIVESPEFWREAPAPDKLKTPFELVASALRALDAEVADADKTLQWVGRAGQPLYTYAAPTGFPDREETWSNVGALLARINFAFELARGKVAGVEVDLLHPLGERDLDSIAEGVDAFLPVLLPERRTGELLRRLAAEGAALAAVAAETEAEAAVAVALAAGEATAVDAVDADDSIDDGAAPDLPPRLRRTRKFAMLAVAGLVASPEFQRR